MSDAAGQLKGAKTRMGAFAKAAPDLFSGFSAVSKAATKPGHFAAADRELIAVAISVATHCEDCILYHVEAAKRHGAEEQALVEVLEVAAEMGGGPAIMYAGKALEVFRSL